MTRRLLILVFLLTACRSWEVNAFGVPVANAPPRLMAASDSEGLSLGAQIAIGAAIVVGAWAIWSAALD